MGNSRSMRRSVQRASAAATVDHAPPVGARNIYRCKECQREIVTVDRDRGVTPSMLACRATEGCEGSMVSGWYPPELKLPVTHVWYRPERKMVRKLRPEAREHVNKGGLLLRPIAPGESYD